MKLPDLLHAFATQLANLKDAAVALDALIESPTTQKTGTAGTLHLYAMDVPPGTTFLEDVPVTIVPPGDVDLPTAGFMLHRQGNAALVQTLYTLGHSTGDNTLVTDTAEFFRLASERLADMAGRPEAYALGPAERLAPWLDPEHSEANASARTGASAAVLTTVWHDDQAARWTKLGTLAVNLMRHNKRVLLVAPTHDAVDRLLGFLAKTLRNAALPFHSLLSRYEVPVLKQAEGVPLGDLGFEAQMHKFFAKSRSHKDALRQKYERFRELIPILAYKGQKQRDMDEVKLLEWRLMAQVSEFQGKIKGIDDVLAKYERLPIWKRLGMQSMGKNVETLGEYRKLYTGNIAALMKEVEVAQARIRELSPEAAIPKEMRPEYEELKEEISRLGGTQKVREMLAASEATNRQAFMQNKRLVVATPGRIVTDPLFKRMRFDVLIAENAPQVPAPFLLGVAGLIREQIIIAGDTQDLQGPHRLWRQQHPELSEPSHTASAP